MTLPNVIVSPEWLAGRLDDPALRLLDVRPRDSFHEAHLPGAAQLDLEAISREIDGVPGMLLPEEVFARKMSELGVGNEQAVVIYDDNWGLPAARVLWALARYGHERAAVLNGGIDRWREAGYRLVSGPAGPPPASFSPQPAGEHLATRDWIEEHLADPDLVLVDTRTPNEFGAGHLPGAICWDWFNGVPVGSWDTVRAASELEAELVALGITPDKEVVTYCRTGARAAHTYVLLRYLGFPRVRLYDGSWVEWIRNDDDETEENQHESEI